MKKLNKASVLFVVALILISGIACQNRSGQISEKNNKVIKDSTFTSAQDKVNGIPSNDTLSGKNMAKEVRTTILIYNFHVTNRCVSCISIEEATTKTLNTYFASEMKQGRIKRQILNVDDEANAKIAEKYQAFGSGLFVTRILKGKETTADLTGDGFKFAKNKEERFIEILKNKIAEFLK
jgi:hypothetical protein